MFQRSVTFVRHGCKHYCSRATRLTNSEISRKRNAVFSEEKARQMALITRIEKVQVVHQGPPEDCTLLMNKHMSTPFNVAMHIDELLMNRSVVAVVNGEPWDMHKPLTEDCELHFLHFKDDVPDIPNQVFWRSCSFILGYILERAFKDEFLVELCSFPRPNVRSGSFVCDADLKLRDWKPSSAELNCLSRIGAKLQHDDIRFERLDVDTSVALKMFEHNRFKTLQIPAIAAQSPGGSTVTVYRMGSHVDITRGPLMSSTRHISRYSVTAVTDIDTPDFGTLKRVQGLAIPRQLPIHYWAYEMLCERSTHLNKAPVPSLSQEAPVAVETQS